MVGIALQRFLEFFRAPYTPKGSDAITMGGVVGSAMNHPMTGVSLGTVVAATEDKTEEPAEKPKDKRIPDDVQ